MNSQKYIVLNSKTSELLENIYTSLIKNRVCKRINGFYCYLCKQELTNLVSTINHLTQDKEHEERRGIGYIEQSVLNDLKFDEIKCAELVLNGIILTSIPMSSCMICECKIPSSEHLSTHIGGFKHTNNKNKQTSNGNSTAVSISNNNSIPSSSAKVSNSNVNNTQSKANMSSCSTIISNGNTNDTKNTKSLPISNNGNIDNVKNTKAPSLQPVSVTNLQPLFKSTSNLSIDKTKSKNISDAKSCVTTSSLVQNSILEANVKKSKFQLASVPKSDQSILAEMFYCFLCNIFLTTKVDIKYHNMFHIHKEDCSCYYTDIIKFSTNSDKHSLTKFIQCRLCNFTTSKVNKLQKHLKDEKHVGIMKLFRAPAFFTSKITCVSTPTLKTACNQKNPSIRKAINCLICDTRIGDKVNDSLKDHLDGQRHKKNLSKFPETKSNFQINVGIETSKAKYICFICDLEYDLLDEYLDHSNNNIQHKTAISKINYILNDKNLIFVYKSNYCVMNCTLCKVTISCPNKMVEHINTISHQNKLNLKSQAVDNASSTGQKIVKTQFVESNKPTTLSTTDLQIMVNPFLCPICNTRLKDENMVKSHFAQKIHKKKMREHLLTNEQKLFPCVFCVKKFKSDTSLFYHLHNLEHKENKTKSPLTEEQLMNWIEKDAKNEIEVVNDDYTDLIEYKLFSDRYGNHQRTTTTTITNNNSLTNSENNTAFDSNNLNLSTNDFQESKYIGLSNKSTIYGSTVSLSADIHSMFRKNESTDLRAALSTSSLNEFCLSSNDQNDSIDSISIKSKLGEEPVKLNLTSQTKTEVFSKFGMTYIKMCLEPEHGNIFFKHFDKLNRIKVSLSLTCPVSRSKRFCLVCMDKISSNPFLIYEHVLREDHLNNLSMIEHYDSYFQGFEGQYSDFSLAKTYMSMSEEWTDLVHCHVCNEDINDSDLKVKNHIESRKHQKKCQEWKVEEEEICKQLEVYIKKLWYYAQKFVCQICDVPYNSELLFLIHVLGDKHVKKVESVENKVEETVCLQCFTYIIGTPGAFEKHCEEPLHKHFSNTKAFIIPELSAPAKYMLNNCNKEIETLSQLSESIDNDEAKVLEGIKEVAKSVYPQNEPHIYGSRSYFIGGPKDELIIYLDCGSYYDELKTIEESQEHLSKIQNSIEKSSDVWMILKSLDCDSNCETEMKVRHGPTNLNCHVSCISTLDIEKSHLIKCYNKMYPTCQKLILYLERWTFSWNVYESTKLTTYALSMIVIFYLQTKGILPNVKELLKKQPGKKIVVGSDMMVDNNIPEVKSDLSVESLLSDMFSFYASFDFMKNVICPYVGEPIEKRIFVDENQSFHKKFVEEKFYLNNFRIDFPMCVQDPLNHAENITMEISKFQLRSFIKYCSDAAVILAAKNKNILG